MNTRFFTATWGLASLFGVAVHAQQASPSSAPSPQPPAFQSALAGYLPYTDDKIVDWKAANDTVAGIGGWRAYAREASAPAMAPTPASAPPQAPAQP